MSDYHAVNKMDGNDCHKCESGTLHKKGNTTAVCDNCSFMY